MVHLLIVFSLSMSLSMIAQGSQFEKELVSNQENLSKKFIVGLSQEAIIREFLVNYQKVSPDNLDVAMQELAKSTLTISEISRIVGFLRASKFLKEHAGHVIPKDKYVRTYQFLEGMQQRYPSILGNKSFCISHGSDDYCTDIISNRIYLDSRVILWLEVGICPEAIEFRLLDFAIDNANSCKILLTTTVLSGITLLASSLCLGVGIGSSGCVKSVGCAGLGLFVLSCTALTHYLVTQHVLSVCSNPDVFKYAYIDFAYAKKRIAEAFYKKFGYELTDEVVEEWDLNYQLETRLFTGMHCFYGLTF